MSLSQTLQPGAGSARESTPRPRSGRSARSPAGRSSADVGCTLAREIASAVLDVPVSEINRPDRSLAPSCQARHVAMYLAHVAMRIPLAAIAGEFGRDRTSVAYGVRRIEDRRDDRDFDALMTRLERLAGVCQAATASHASGAGVRREG